MNTRITILRYDPEKKRQYWQDFDVPFHNDLTILEALNWIKNGKSPSLAFREACGMGICGSCAAIVNGKHVLMCQTFCRDLKKPIVIEPLRSFPVIKDLVTDIEHTMEKFRTAMPYTTIQNRHAAADHELLQNPSQRKKIAQASQCIKCLLCYSACPIFALNRDFIGPAAAASAFRYNNDNRDHLKEKRFDSIIKDEGIYKCSFVGECSIVCPKSVDPASALQKLKVAGVLHTVKKMIKKKHGTSEE